MSNDLKHIESLKDMSNTGLVAYFHSLQERVGRNFDTWEMVKYFDAKVEMEKRGLI